MDTDKKKRCNICFKIYTRTARLNLHLKNIHEINSKGERVPKNKFLCEICAKQFTEKSHLRRHLFAIHLVPENPSLRLECSECNYKTTTKWNLERHMKQHKSKKESLKGRFKCPSCSAHFHYIKSLRLHQRKKHGLQNIPRKCSSDNMKCPLCSFVSVENGKRKMIVHFEKVHEINIKWDEYSFDNLSLFYKWKRELEVKTCVSYIKRNQTQRRLQFLCGRSGFYRPRGKNIRQSKVVGSRKIDAFCPAEIKVILNKSGLVSVKHMSCHVGHKNEITHMRLAAEDKKLIAKQLLNKTPPDEILKGIMNSLSNGNLQRIHLINKKDIYNIEKSLKLNNKAVKHVYGPISNGSKVQEMKTNEDTEPLQKPHNVTDDHRNHDVFRDEHTYCTPFGSEKNKPEVNEERRNADAKELTTLLEGYNCIATTDSHINGDGESAHEDDYSEQSLVSDILISNASDLEEPILQSPQAYTNYDSSSVIIDETTINHNLSEEEDCPKSKCTTRDLYFCGECQRVFVSFNKYLVHKLMEDHYKISYEAISGTPNLWLPKLVKPNESSDEDEDHDNLGKQADDPDFFQAESEMMNTRTPYSCTECPSLFTNKGNLITHYFSRHKENTNFTRPEKNAISE